MFDETNSLICPVSGNQKFEELFTIKSFPIYMGTVDYDYNYEFQDLTFNICKTTGTVQIFPRVELEKLYFKSHGSGKIGALWKEHHEKFFEIIKKYLFGTVVEIGGGHNSIHSLIGENSQSCKIYSFDPNGERRKNSNLKVINKFFTEKAMIEESINSVDLFIHSHLLEHIYDPLNFLNTIQNYLNKDGFHIFSIPNIRAMIKSGYANAMNFEHPFFLEESLVEDLLSMSGHLIIDKFYLKDHSIIFKTRKTNTSFIKRKKNYNKYNDNKKLFLKLIKNWKKDVNEINKYMSKSTKNFFLFGAHIFSQNLLSLGLNTKKIKAILDNDPSKHSNYLYGTNFKVDSPKILRKFDEPIVILRVGSYKNEIMRGILEVNKNTIFI
tara:strand:+ start:559 stop:1701 length:1143 start_codon:yes stop_codon:yes gene_type:complete